MRHFLLLKSQECVIKSDKHEFDVICVLRYFRNHRMTKSLFTYGSGTSNSMTLIQETYSRIECEPQMIHKLQVYLKFTLGIGTRKVNTQLENVPRQRYILSVHYVELWTCLVQNAVSGQCNRAVIMPIDSIHVQHDNT
jgi:hypothetical protein